MNISDLQLAEPVPVLLWACDYCGCTDVEESAWISMNTGKCTGDEGPTDQNWCPECGSRTEGEVSVSQEATEPQPYDSITEEAWAKATGTCMECGELFDSTSCEHEPPEEEGANE
jgi:hypothetical protein